MFVAPASKLLTVLHIPDQDDAAYTQCGLPMEPDELWIPVERDTEPVCGACQGITEEQGALI